MLVNLVRGFVDLGETVEVVMLRADSPCLADLPPQVNQFALGRRHALTAIPALVRYLRYRRPPVMLVAKDRAGRAALLARWLARVDTRLVLRLGTNLSAAMRGRSALARWLRVLPIRLLYRQLDHIVAVSGGVAEDTRRVARLPARVPVSVIRNPVVRPELQRLAAEPCPHPWLQDGLVPTVVAAGRLQRQKDFPTLLRAFALLREERDCRLIILGEGGERDALCGLIDALGLREVVALPGFQGNPYAWLARARLFVLSSRWEGSPNVLTEALALGTPVVATDCPSGPAEILAGGRYGALVPVGDAPTLARAMAATLAAPLSPELLCDAVSEYRQTHAAGRYLQVLRTVQGQAGDV